MYMFVPTCHFMPLTAGSVHIFIQQRRLQTMAIKRLVDIQCYRGKRHRAGLPVRGEQFLLQSQSDARVSYADHTQTVRLRCQRTRALRQLLTAVSFWCPLDAFSGQNTRTNARTRKGKKVTVAGKKKATK